LGKAPALPAVAGVTIYRTVRRHSRVAQARLPLWPLIGPSPVDPNGQPTARLGLPLFASGHM